MSRPPVRIANCSGFYGDRRGAAAEMVDGGPIDVLTGDWLAELTMLILAKAAARGRPGWATTFLRELEPVLGTIVDRDIKVVANAGGLDPAGCAAAVRELAARLGLDVAVAHVEGDDLRHRFDDLVAAGWEATNLDTREPFSAAGAPALSANAYLGGWGITEALSAGAQIVVTGRVVDAAVVSGSAAWWHGWAADHWDRLAGAVAAGHVIECGAQATGGNFAFVDEIESPVRPGFPIAEVADDGSSVITKHEGTGGAVITGTVVAQLLYEVGGPHYLGPDVVTDLSTLAVDQDGPDRVRISGATGSPPPPSLKVSVNADGGFRNSMTFMVTGLDAEAKAAFAEAGLWDAIDGGQDAFDEVHRSWWAAGRDDPATNLDAVSMLRITVHSRDERVVGRPFADAVVGLALSTYPGCFTSSPPGPAQQIGLYWPTLIDRAEVSHEAVLADGSRIAVADPPVAEAPVDDDEPGEPETAATDADAVGRPFGQLIGARSGDKGGNANLGVWARSDAAFQWLDGYLTTERLRALLPDVCDGRVVRRHRLPNLRALNFVIVGLLGRGVAGSPRLDAQAKGLGEYLRAKHVPIPEELL